MRPRVQQDAGEFAGRQDDGPMRCICSLCDCGFHSCANFTPLPDGQLTASPAANESSSAMDQQQQQQQQCAAAAALQERYLSAGEPRQAAEDQDELVHVLVTRPALASKPRDNIIFEGDMDLKTTFETSYEALAKMRLECWKKYQEAKQMSLANQRRSKRSSPQRDGSGQDEVSRSRPAAASPKKVMAKRKSTRIAHTNTEPTSGHHKRAPGRHQAPEAKPQETSSASSPPINYSRVINDLSDPPHVKRARATGSAPAPPNSSDLQQQQQELGHLVRAAELEAAELDGAGSRRSAGASPVMDASTNTEAEAEAGVDPDLSSIIVYDSNLNRLERVGLRKRSKYRPSTSLKPGARGLFGDQSLEPEESERPARGGAGETQRLHTHGAGKPSADRSDWRPAASATPNASPEARGCAAGLTYSNQNLPVDSKRRLRDNINMTDHIRDHNIVASGTEVPMDGRVGIYGQFAGVLSPSCEPQLIRDVQLAEPGADQPEADVINKLNEMEEAAAVEEIRRAASGASRKASASTPATVSPQPQSGSNRQHKTCQQQNFYLYKNEYPEPKEDPDRKKASGLVGAASPTPPSRASYKNLFRESPDFIMTTGKFNQQSGSKTNGYASAARAPMTRQHSSDEAAPINTRISSSLRKSLADLTIGENESAGADIGGSHYTSIDGGEGDDDTMIDYYNNDSRQTHYSQITANSSPTKDHCRVLKLGDEFDFVESRSGHKFFVQKPPSPIKR